MITKNRILVLYIVVIICSLPLLQAIPNSQPSPIIESSSLQTDISEDLLEGGSRYEIQGWVYIHISGEAYERGYQYGYLAAEEIIDLMQRWSYMIHNQPSMKPISTRLPQQLYDRIAGKWWDFCLSTAEEMYWDEYPQEYKDEIRGIADGIADRGFLIHGHEPTYQDVLASNSMYEMLSKLTQRKIRKGIHPIATFFDWIRPDISPYMTVDEETFISDFMVDPLQPYPHKCSSFIATGNATSDGQLIISNSMWSSTDGAGMWWWANYIAIRWNMVLDVNPSQGHRFQMTCAPGYIWSDHDFYQNNEGIVFIETTLPQGRWSEKGLPLAVRARTAVQYASSIDDVIRFLRTENDGVMNAVWLIGDTTTGEICRYELGLYHDAVIERTFNGFQWSANNPMDFWVRWEKMDWRLFFQQLLYHFILGANNHAYHTPWYLPADRDIAFEELGNDYYGSIDVEIVKTIMATPPIGLYSPDGKITSTNLVANNGMWVHTGNPSGTTMDMARFDQPEIIWQTIEPVGWTRLYGLPNPTQSQTTDHTITQSPTIVWKTIVENSSNDFFSHGIIVDDILYATTSNGRLYALDPSSGIQKWSVSIGMNPTRPYHVNGSLFIGSHQGLHKLDIQWGSVGTKSFAPILSPPVGHDSIVYFGTIEGDVYALDVDSAAIKWHQDVDDEAWVSLEHGFLIVSSDDTVYKFDAATGMLLWRKLVDGPLTTPGLIIDDIMYIGSWDTQLTALDFSTGQVHWSTETGWGIETVPVISEEQVFIGSHDGNIYSLNRDSGEQDWVFSCSSGIHQSPVLIDDLLICGSDDGNLYALEKATGIPVWSYAPGRIRMDKQSNYFTTALRSDLIVYQDMVIMGACGSLYCIQTK